MLPEYDCILGIILGFSKTADKLTKSMQKTLLRSFVRKKKVFMKIKEKKKMQQDVRCYRP